MIFCYWRLLTCYLNEPTLALNIQVEQHLNIGREY
jgi:hypothetical protein